jgi:DNA-binding transcriptional LysR family regulator
MRRQRRAIDVADAAHGLQLLVGIADAGSFTAAGVHLGLSPSAVSKAVTRIEQRLGVRLLQRTTRRVAFTDAGEAYVARGRQLVADFEGLEREDRRGFYASPAYLRGARAPRTLDDLTAHAVIVYSGGATKLRRGRVVFATDSVLAAREAARGGLGIAELPEYLARDDAAAGSLREVLPGAVPATRKIYALYLPSRYLPPQVRAFVDVLVRDAASRPW